MAIEYDYWDINRTLSYDCLMNAIIGQRGCGKTYGSKEYVLNRFAKKGESCLYLRQTKKNIDETSDWLDHFHEKYPELKQKKNKIVDAQGNVAVWLYGLTEFGAIKSAIKDSNITTIILDEFTDYVQWTQKQSKVWCFLNICDSVIRTRTNVRILLLGNSVGDMDNEYFHYFKIMPDTSQKFTLYRKQGILVEFVKSEKFAEQRKNTPFGRLIADTDYGTMSLDSKFENEDLDNIAKMHNDNMIIAYVQDKQDTVAIYLDKIDKKIYMKLKNVYTSDPVITLDTDRTASYNYFKYSKEIWQLQLVNAIQTNNLRFNDVMSRSASNRILKGLGIL